MQTKPKRVENADVLYRAISAQQIQTIAMGVQVEALYSERDSEREAGFVH